MTFNLSKILQSKRDFRQSAAARPIEEKLAMLDALRERALGKPGWTISPCGITITTSMNANLCSANTSKG